MAFWNRHKHSWKETKRAYSPPTESSKRGSVNITKMKDAHYFKGFTVIEQQCETCGAIIFNYSSGDLTFK